MAYPETGGGPSLYVGSHLVDLFLWFLQDEPTSVYANTTHRDETDADRTSVFQIRFARGAFAQGFVAQSARGFSYELTVQGEKGTVALRGRTFSQFEIEVFSQVLSAYAEPTIIRPLLWHSPVITMFVPELEEFASAIQDRRPPSITVADGRRVLRALDAAGASSQTGQPVCLSN